MPEITEEQVRRFMDVLSRGGLLVVHPDTYAALLEAGPSKYPPAFTLATLGNKVMKCEWVEPGKFFAVETPSVRVRFGFAELEMNGRFSRGMLKPNLPWAVSTSGSTMKHGA